MSRKLGAIQIRVIVDELIPNSLIKSGDVIPAFFEGHPVEVFEDEPPLEKRLSKNRRSPGAKYHEILRPGIACGGRGTTNGTLGAIVFDLKNGHAPCILSNYHVLRGIWRNERWTTDTFQPGQLIGGTPFKNVVATYKRPAGVGIDAAIATLNNKRKFDTKVLTSNMQFTGVRAPKKHDLLEKSGSRTSVTRAEVYKVKGVKAWLRPVGGSTPNAREISKSGDSGSVWYDPETGEAVILHDTGDTDGDTSREWAGGFAMPVVAKALDISFTPA